MCRIADMTLNSQVKVKYSYTSVGRKNANFYSHTLIAIEVVLILFNDCLCCGDDNKCFECLLVDYP